MNPLKTYFYSQYSVFKHYFASQFYISKELQVFLLQGMAFILLAVPGTLIEDLTWKISCLLTGAFLQFRASFITHIGFIHESFLKRRLDSYFENPPGKAEDESAEYYRYELNRCLRTIAEPDYAAKKGF